MARYSCSACRCASSARLRAPLLRLAQLALDGGHEARQITLENEIVRAAPHHLHRSP